MANITRIKAKDTAPEKLEKPKPAKKDKTFHAREEKSAKSLKKPTELKKDKTNKARKTENKKKPFILFRPFIALGSYLYASWKELRQVRWPNRTSTWKMVFAVFIYTLIFSAFLVALDVLFDFIFSKILA